MKVRVFVTGFLIFLLLFAVIYGREKKNVAKESMETLEVTTDDMSTVTGEKNDGKNEYNKEPEDSITCISSGWAGALVTENGELYMWNNVYDESAWQNETWLFDNSIEYSFDGRPVKLLEDINFVTQADGNYAALTENSELYIWGTFDSNDSYKSIQPIKILDNVRTVSLSETDTCIAVTNTGDLYYYGNWYIPDSGYQFYDKPQLLANGVKTACVCVGGALVVGEDGSLREYCEGREKLICQGYDIEKISSLGPGNFVFLTNSGEFYVWWWEMDSITKIMDHVEKFSAHYSSSGLDDVIMLVTEEHELYLVLENGSSCKMAEKIEDITISNTITTGYDGLLKTEDGNVYQFKHFNSNQWMESEESNSGSFIEKECVAVPFY